MKTLLLLSSLLLATTIANAALNFEVTITAPGGLTEADKLAAIDQVEKENVRRAALETPLPALPYATLQELADSYETLASQILNNAHNDYKRQAAEEDLNELKAQLDALWRDATDADRQAAIAAAIAALTP